MWSSQSILLPTSTLNTCHCDDDYVDHIEYDDDVNDEGAAEEDNDDDDGDDDDDDGVPWVTHIPLSLSTSLDNSQRSAGWE